MSIIGIVLVLLVIGFVLYALQTVPIPVHPWIKMVITGIIAFAALVWVLNEFGIHTGIPIHL